MESPSLEEFKRHLNLALGDLVWWFRGYSGGGWLDWMILKASSSLDDSRNQFYDSVRSSRSGPMRIILNPKHSTVPGLVGKTYSIPAITSWDNMHKSV